MQPKERNYQIRYSRKKGIIRLDTAKNKELSDKMQPKERNYQIRYRRKKGIIRLDTAERKELSN